MRVIRSLLLLIFLSGAAIAQSSSIQHIVVIVQENRSPDNLFQGLCAPPFGDSSACSTTPTGRQYNIQTSNWLDKTSSTGFTQPAPIPLANTYDLGHGHIHAWNNECDKNSLGQCLMDGAALVSCAPASQCTKFTHPQFRYVDYMKPAHQLDPYLILATQYGWANYMFQTNQGPSFSAHQFLFGATSAPSAADDRAGIFAAENIGEANILNVGCIADARERVQLIDQNGVEKPSNKIFPCFEHETVADLLDALNINWTYYTTNITGAQAIWTAPVAINHICVPSAGKCRGKDWTKGAANGFVDGNSKDVLTDISNCQLARVSWVTPRGQNSDHPGGNNGEGPAWVASIVNAIGNSWTNSKHKCDYWGNNSNDSTAIFITWDDWGGWYDHEPPPMLAFPEGAYQLGFRVPMIVVSAYTPQLVNNSRLDFGSIVRYIEQNFGIAEGALTFADRRAFTDFTSFFELKHNPRPFQTIPAIKDAKYFLEDKTVPTSPDDD
jgi:phospholipase C